MPERAIHKTDFHKSEQSILSIRLGADGFSFSVYHPFDKQPATFLYKETTPSLTFIANLQQIFSESDFLSFPYEQINILTVSTRYTIFPLNLFDEQQAESVFHYNHLKKDNEIILYNVLKKNEIALIFGMDKTTYQFLKEQYPQAVFYSQATSFIEYFSDSEKDECLSKRMCICLYEKSIDICCFEHKQLIFINSFACRHTEDCMYYILHTWKQLDLDQQSNSLYITGTPDKQELINELKRYISHVIDADIHPSNHSQKMSYQNIPFCSFKIQ